MGIFEAIVESNTRIALATFHVTKGHKNTEPLIGFQTTEDLGLVKAVSYTHLTLPTIYSV